jgi:hypothetical protein
VRGGLCGLQQKRSTLGGRTSINILILRPSLCLRISKQTSSEVYSFKAVFVLIKGIVRPFEAGVESRPFRSVMMNWSNGVILTVLKGHRHKRSIQPL